MGGCCHCLVSSRPVVSVSLLPVSDSSGVCIGQFWHFTASSCHPRGPFHMSWALPRLGWTQLVLTLLVLVSSVLREGRNTQWGKPGTENCAPGLTGRSFWPCSSVWEQFLDIMNFGGGIKISVVVSLQRMNLAFVWERSVDVLNVGGGIQFPLWGPE